MPFGKTASSACNPLPVFTREVSGTDKQDLRKAIKESVDGRSGNAFGAASCHRFSNELVRGVVRNSYRLFTVNDVFECLPVYSINHSLKILELVLETFGDIPNFHVTDFFCFDG